MEADGSGSGSGGVTAANHWIRVRLIWKASPKTQGPLDNYARKHLSTCSMLPSFLKKLPSTVPEIMAHELGTTV